jgi:hypothetical protein
MTPLTWSILIIAILAVAFAVVILIKTRTKHLKSKFGPEYERAVREQAARSKPNVGLRTEQNGSTNYQSIRSRRRRVRNLPLNGVLPRKNLSTTHAALWPLPTTWFIAR